CAVEPVEPKVQPLKDPLPYQTFAISLRSLGGVRIRGKLALPPRGAGVAELRSVPVIVTAPGYGSTQQGVMLSECQRGYAILQIYPRSQGDSAEEWKIDGPD